MNAEEEIRASLVADLDDSHVFHQDAEYEADDLIQRMKKEWSARLMTRATEAMGVGPYSAGFLAVLKELLETE